MKLKIIEETLVPICSDDNDDDDDVNNDDGNNDDVNNGSNDGGRNGNDLIAHRNMEAGIQLSTFKDINCLVLCHKNWLVL